MKKLLSILLLALSSTAVANPPAWTPQWTHEGIPNRIAVDGSSGFMVYLDYADNLTDPTGCNLPFKGFYVQGYHPQRNQIFATMLAAYTGGKKVRAFINDCLILPFYSETQYYPVVKGSSGVWVYNKVGEKK